MVDYPEYLDLAPYMSQIEHDLTPASSEFSVATAGELLHSFIGSLLWFSYHSSDDTRFELCSLVVHSGSTVHSGHYFAYVKQAGADSNQPDK